jgi:hypothetical protein
MKTEQQYADELIDKYKELTKYGHWDDCINCAIIDVTNTIEAMSKMKLIFSDRIVILKYYKTVLTILKDKI